MILRLVGGNVLTKQQNCQKGCLLTLSGPSGAAQRPLDQANCKLFDCRGNGISSWAVVRYKWNFLDSSHVCTMKQD